MSDVAISLDAILEQIDVARIDHEFWIGVLESAHDMLDGTIELLPEDPDEPLSDTSIRSMLNSCQRSMSATTDLINSLQTYLTRIEVLYHVMQGDQESTH